MKNIFVILFLFLISCASKEAVKEEEQGLESLYNNAMDLLIDYRFKQSIKLFQEIERTYPYSEWAVRAKLMSAYAYFKDEDYESTILILDKFIKLHPAYENIDYAYYLIALSNYKQISDIYRDQGNTEKAKESLEAVIIRFPKSEYAADSLIKLNLVNDYLAGKQLEIGRFYLKRKKYIAAINRFKNIVNDYQTTNHVEEALHRLVEAYISLGIISEAKKYASILGHNFPSSKWYKFSYKLLKNDS